MEEILKTDIPRKEGYLYFCKGNPITVYKAKMSRGGRPRVNKEKPVKTKEVRENKIKRID